MSAQENKRKHLDFVQLTITRMAADSFLLKAWGVTLIAALMALSVKDSQGAYWLIAFIPVIAFWILDAYFLWQERLYRKLYDAVRLTEAKDTDFALDASIYQNKVDSWFRGMFSKTLAIFWGTITVVLVLIMLFTSTSSSSHDSSREHHSPRSKRPSTAR